MSTIDADEKVDSFAVVAGGGHVWQGVEVRCCWRHSVGAHSKSQLAFGSAVQHHAHTFRHYLNKLTLWQRG